MLACRGLETKLKHCLVGSNIFADETEGVDPKQQVRPPDGLRAPVEIWRYQRVCGQPVSGPPHL